MRRQSLVAFIAFSLFASCHTVDNERAPSQNFAEPSASTTGLEFDRLVSDFGAPPEDAEPYMYWFWMEGDISREGITADIEAMKRAGIAEFYLFNINYDSDQAVSVNPGPELDGVEILSDEWWDLITFAAEEAARIGVGFGFHNTNGWSQAGGPWNTPDNSMRFLNDHEISVSGPARIETELITPSDDFQPVMTLAFPTPKKDKDLLKVVNVTMIASGHEYTNVGALFDDNPSTVFSIPMDNTVDSTLTLDVYFENVDVIRNIAIYTDGGQSYFDVDVMVNDEVVRTLNFDRRNIWPALGFKNMEPVVASFAPVRTDHVTLKIYNRMANYNGGLSKIEFSGGARLEHYNEKQLGKMWQTPLPAWDAYEWRSPPEVGDQNLLVSSDSLIDLSHAIDDEGHLSWDAPPGEWTILQFGMTPTGTVNWPAEVQATGPEVDKLDSAAVRKHFDNFAGDLLTRVSPKARANVTRLTADSYEVGGQNWSDSFATRFEKHFGYSPLPWLPVFTGRIVESADQSDRFLWDIRRLVADLMSQEYVSTMTEEADKNGLVFQVQNYGHWGFPAESMSYGGAAHEVAGEFWFEPEMLGPIELRIASSTVNTYGKHRTSAEAFTTSDQGSFSKAPGDLKARGDWAAVQGINHFVLILTIHQPRDEKPGVNAFFSQAFNRHNTWYEEMPAFTDYLKRSHAVLQSGVTAADLLYFIGEGAPKMTGILEPSVPAGYDFDFINAEVLFERVSIENNAFVLPEGNSYKLLVLPPSDAMTPELLERIAEFVKAGGAIYGSQPVRSPSLKNFPDADNRVRAIADEMWGDCGVTGKMSVSYGNGVVYCGGALEDALAERNAPADVRNTPANDILWKHRTGHEVDVYFISNQTDQLKEIAPSFRNGGQSAEIWDAVTGMRYRATVEKEDGRFTVPLSLAPTQSLFVVFSDEADAALPVMPHPEAGQLLTTLDSGWTVAFDPEWGGPGDIPFPAIVDWTKHDDPGVQHYSGTATYRTHFSLDATQINGTVMLDLGIVHDLARIRVNEQDLGVLWTAPWRVDITDALSDGENTIQIDVTNTWANRIIGDLKGIGDNPPYTTYTLTRYNQKSPLLPAGISSAPRLFLQ